NFSENSTLGMYVQGNFGGEDAFEDLNQRSMASASQLDSLFVRNSTEMEDNGNFEAGVNYTVELDTAGHRFYTSFSYSKDHRDHVNEYFQHFYNLHNEEVPSKGLVQLNDRTSGSTFYIFQADYTKPLGKSSSLEAGLKGTFGT